MDRTLQHLVSTSVHMREHAEQMEKEEDVIKVSETVSVAASAYETVRNALEYDEEHLLRRNAIRRILKRDMVDGPKRAFAKKLIRELIWAKYLPNEQVPTRMISKVEDVLGKYIPLFETLEPETDEGQRRYDWLLDVLSVEIEYCVSPPCIDEALASYAYQELKGRVEWKSNSIAQEDRDLQLYIGIHRSVLKSNRPTLRYRVFTLYYPQWRKASPKDPVISEVKRNLATIIEAIEGQITHPVQDVMYRFVRRHAIVFHTLADIIKDSPEEFTAALQSGDIETIDSAITKATNERYSTFRARLFRTVLRASVFLLLTKSVFELLIELPYKLLFAHSIDYFPIIINILFPPVLIAVIGLSIRIPKKANTEKILDELHAILGVGEDFDLIFKYKGSWKGAIAWIFNGLYVLSLVLSIVVIAILLASVGFDGMSSFFFIFFLSLVAYFGIRIRNTKRELMVIDPSRGFIPTLVDIMFLPLIRAGRWMSIRAPKVNVFLFFFDFIIEAPFKASFSIFESWLAFLREKREEI